jgi:DNA gyrase subunit A
MIINKSGIVIRLAVKDLRVMGRATQGVRLINLRNGDSIAAVTRVEHNEDEIDQIDEEGNIIAKEITTTIEDNDESEDTGKDIDTTDEELDNEE